MELTGKIIQQLPLQSGQGKNGEWKKQEYILETNNSQFPKKVCFNVWGDKIGQFNLQAGQDVSIEIEIESREFNSRWYTEVRAWKVNTGSESAPSAPTPKAAAAAPKVQVPPTNEAPFPSSAPPMEDDEDDLPF